MLGLSKGEIRWVAFHAVGIILKTSYSPLYADRATEYTLIKTATATRVSGETTVQRATASRYSRKETGTRDTTPTTSATGSARTTGPTGTVLYRIEGVYGYTILRPFRTNKVFRSSSLKFVFLESKMLG